MPSTGSRCGGAAAGGRQARIPHRYEPVPAIHRAPGRHHASHSRCGACGRSRLSAAASLAAAASRLSDHLGVRLAAGRRSRDHVHQRGEPLERHLGEIADVTEITSTSSIGQTRITLQFDLDRDINGAARDVQAAINAASADVSTSLSSNPTYRKVNPADAPLMILALTSKTLTRGQLYDAASNVLQQRLSQLDGIGQVSIGGATLPAVRVELNPTAMFRYGIGLEDVRAALASANANSPKGAIEQGDHRFQLYTNDQASHASDYRPLIVAYRNGAAVQLTDIADVEDSVQDLRNEGRANGEPSVLVILSRQPGANIIDTVDQVKEALPQLQASLPSDVNLTIVSDRSRRPFAHRSGTRNGRCSSRSAS